MGRQNWRSSSNAQTAHANYVRILQHPRAQKALDNYLKTINFQGMTPKQAQFAFQEAIHLFVWIARQKSLQVTQQPDQSNLILPINMTLALQNPNSTASQLMNGIDAATQQVIQEEVEEEIEGERITIQNIETESNQMTTQNQSEQSTTGKIAGHVIVDAALLDGLKKLDGAGVDALEKFAKNIFEKNFPNLSQLLHETESGTKLEERSLRKILKPTDS